MKILGLSFWKELGKGFFSVFSRFPLVVLSGIICAVAAGLLIDLQPHEDVAAFSRLVKLAFASGLGISTFILTGLIAEDVGGKFSIKGLILSAAGLLFVIGFGLLIPIDDQGRVLNAFGMRLLMMGGIIHLGIAVCPYLKLNNTDSAIWEYNKLLLIRALISAFYAWVFFVGVALALVSIDKLFGVDIEEINYARIWFFCAFVLATCLFLGGVPTKEDRPRLVVDYPKWIHFFCKFILLPLVVLYFGILYAYAVKIVATWTWPDGMVGMPVFILAAVGGLTGLLIWPLTRLEPVSKWAKSFWRLYFPLIIPLGFLLLLALQRRIGDYGFTEVRYLGLVLACWLLAIAVYYTIRPGSSFRVIPWSLIGVLDGLLMGAPEPGPDGLQQPMETIKRLLEQEGLLVDGALTPNPHQVDDSVYRDLKSVIQYLHGSYGSKPFSPLIENVDPSVRTDSEGKDWLEKSSYGFAQAIMDYAGLVSDEGSGYKYFRVRADPTKPVPIGDVIDLYIINWRDFDENRSLRNILIEGSDIHMVKDSDSSDLVVRNSADEELARLDFAGWIDDHDQLNLPVNRGTEQVLDPMELVLELDLGELGSVTIMVRSLGFERLNGDWSLGNGEFWVLVPAE